MTRADQWQVSGDAAVLYERYVVPHILGPWAASLIDAADVSAGERVLDVACGTGVVARLAAERVGAGGRVVGLDLNPGMLAVARSLCRSAGSEIEWLQRSALDLGLPGAGFDVVLCQQGLQFFPDKSLALREMHRVLDGDGRLALSVWNSAGIYNNAVGIALREFISPEVADRFCASRKAPDAEELVRLLKNAGFQHVDVRIARREAHLPTPDKFVLCHLASTPVADVVAALPAETHGRIGARVMHELSRYVDGDGVTYPEETHLVTAGA